MSETQEVASESTPQPPNGSPDKPSKAEAAALAAALAAVSEALGCEPTAKACAAAAGELRLAWAAAEEASADSVAMAGRERSFAARERHAIAAALNCEPTAEACVDAIERLTVAHPTSAPLPETPPDGFTPFPDAWIWDPEVNDLAALTFIAGGVRSWGGTDYVLGLTRDEIRCHSLTGALGAVKGGIWIRTAPEMAPLVAALVAHPDQAFLVCVEPCRRDGVVRYRVSRHADVLPRSKLSAAFAKHDPAAAPAGA